MFRKILIANRGEIALRILCACKELGIHTVAVYSEADRNSLHVRFADEAICIGPPRSAESYLNIPHVISAAEIANVDAIHPGYGFLSENANFAEVCEASHITFIGPTPDSIRLMGEKDKARQEMAKAGLPIIPGSPGVIPDEESARRAADEIGYPVMIKAAEGGGGRGMRIVRSKGELVSAFQTARAEAEQAFGSPNVYIEKLIERPRHIEFQVLGDRHGDVMHLGERECSIQRRHQKVLEESPSTAIDAKVRKRTGEQVVNALKKIGYSSAGTVEFLREDSGKLYFIEMNARIQVEHPVTEMVTRVDLVKSQIRLAAGEKLQDVVGQVEYRGHAIECRINAEDPETFTPSAGRITAFRVPGGPGIRVDTAAYSDAVIPPYYDSLIAKLVAHGHDREEAIARMLCALDGFVVEGVKTTIPLHKRILADPEFVPENSIPTSSNSFRRSKQTYGGHSLFPGLYAILDASPAGESDLALAEVLAAAGVQLIQLRNKNGSAREIYDASLLWARRLSSMGARLIVNDRPDIAALAGAGGVHVGQEDLPVEAARKVSGAGRWVGVSTHNLEQLREAALTSADYIAVGPVFPTATKNNPDPVVGLELLRAARRVTEKPLVAIGGITLESAEAVFQAGADSVAVIKDLVTARDPGRRARDYLESAARARARHN